MSISPAPRSSNASDPACGMRMTARASPSPSARPASCAWSSTTEAWRPAQDTWASGAGPPRPSRSRRATRRRLTTGHLGVEISTAPLRLAFLDPGGQWLLRQPEHDGMSSEPRAGDLVRRRVRVAFEFSGEQHFYGLGQGGSGFDRLGATRQLWNTHLGHGPGSDMGVPSSCRTAAMRSSSTTPRRRWSRSADPMGACRSSTRPRREARLVFSPRPRHARRHGRGGGAPRAGSLPPRWALGFLQSTRHFDDTAELRRLPHTIREKRIPCDGLIYLSTYGEARGWNRGVGHLGFQPELWPDPQALIDEARALHFEVTTHEYPVLHEASPLFEEAELRGFLLAEGYGRPAGAARPTIARDSAISTSPTRPCARGGGRPTASSAKLGVAGWWLDGGEGPPARSRLHLGDGALLHNIYDRFRHQAFAEGEAADRPDQRVFLLCRSGAAGMQQYGSTCWSGDINNDFATLDAQIPLGLSTGLSGIPYWGTDVGASFIPFRRRPSSTHAGSSWARSAPSSARMAGCGASTCRGRTARRSRPYAVATPSCAIACSPTRTPWPGRPMPMAFLSCAPSS